MNKEIKCSNCNKVLSKVYVISEATQELDLKTKEYGTPEMWGNTLRTECECGEILSEGDL